MKKNQIEKISIYGIVTLMVAIVALCAFYILYNVGWIVGDDAMVIRRTGWGHFFTPSETVTPNEGRFYPFAYIIYNILPIIGQISVNAHFVLHTIVFVLFSSVSFFAAYKAIDTNRYTWQDFVLVLSTGLVCISRVYSNFLDAYSTIWVDYTLIMIWALCCYYVHKRQSIGAMIIGLLSVIWLTYCLETNFVFPLAYGIIGLLFMRRNSTKLEKAYHLSLVGVGVIFLLLYFFICYLHIDEAYDGSHGQEIHLIKNAIKMFVTQKVLWVAICIVGWRFYRIIVKKEEFEFWDSMLLTGFAYCCGCAIMKLNWTLYYSLASLLLIPSIVHYLHKYLGGKWAWIVMLGLALFTFRKVPYYITENQRGRQKSAETIGLLVSEYQKGQTLFWYSPQSKNNKDFDVIYRSLLHGWVETQFAREINNEYYELIEITDYNDQPGIYIVPSENEKIVPHSNDAILETGVIIEQGETRNLTIIKKM